MPTATVCMATCIACALCGAEVRNNRFELGFCHFADGGLNIKPSSLPLNFLGPTLFLFLDEKKIDSDLDEVRPIFLFFAILVRADRF